MSVDNNPNVNVSRFPSDLVHLLMSKNTYEADHNQNQLVDFNGETWKIDQVFRDEVKFLKMCSFKAIIYTNPDKKQMVLAFKGLDAEFTDIFSDEGALSNNINGILLNGLIPQLLTCYDVTDKANKIAQQHGYNLSFTGFSNGAWLAEYAIYYAHRYLKANKLKLKAVLFESPGIIKSLEKLEPNVVNNQNRYDVYELADSITCYLSSPNFSNSCNKHLGNAYRIFIDYGKSKNEIELDDKLDILLDELGKKIANIKAIKSCRFFAGALLSMFSHEKIDKFILEFDKESGKPTYSEKVTNWPIVQLKLSNSYEKNFKKLINSGLKKAIRKLPLPDFIKSPISYAIRTATANLTCFLADRVVPGMHLLVNILIELLNDNIGFEQFDSVLFEFKIQDRRAQSINESFSSFQKRKIELYLENSYETEMADFKQEKLNIIKPNIDWYLDELQKPNAHIHEIEWLNKLTQCYTREEKANQEIHIKIVDNQYGIDTIEKLKHSLMEYKETTNNTNKSLMRVLEQPLNKDLIEFELVDRMPVLKGSCIEREVIYELIREILGRRSYALIQGLGGVGKTTLAIQYANRMKKLFSQNELIVRFVDASDPRKLIQDYEQLASLLSIESSERIDHLVEKVHAKLRKYTRKKFLFIFDNLRAECVPNFKLFLNGINNENMGIVVTTRNSDIASVCASFELIRLDDYKFSRNEAEGFIRLKLAHSYTDEKSISRILKSMYANEECISGEKLDLSIAYALKYYCTQSLGDIITRIKTNSNRDMASRILSDVEKDSKEDLLIDAVKYLDASFISNEFVKILIGVDQDDDVLKVVEGLERQGLIKRIEIGLVYGVRVHDNVREVIEEYRSERTDLIDWVIDGLNGIKPYERVGSKEMNKFKEFYNHLNALICKLDSKKESLGGQKYVEYMEKLTWSERRVVKSFKNFHYADIQHCYAVAATMYELTGEGSKADDCLLRVKSIEEKNIDK